MKVGMIFECGPEGPDKKVCEYLAKKMIPDLEVRSETLDVKPNLLAECGTAAAILLNQGCDLVLVIWDLYPAWRQGGEKPCRHEDKEKIHQSLADAGVDAAKVRTICVEEELESWLLADGRALSKFLSSDTHLVTIKDEKRPDRINNPKKQMIRVFDQNGGRVYTDTVHAIKIAEALSDLKRIRRSKTFMYFAQKLTGNPAFSPA
jgi:uncharacterized protein DUF4276